MYKYNVVGYLELGGPILFWKIIGYVVRPIMKHFKTIHEGQRNYKCDSCGKIFLRMLLNGIKSVYFWGWKVGPSYKYLGI